jgi:tetratricopeptide (TPR) repeat protein
MSLNPGPVEEGNFSKAETFFLKALDVKHDYAVGHVNVANAFLLQQKFDLAVDHYKEAIKFNSKDNLALFNLGMAYLALQKLDDAINSFKKIIEQDPDFSQAHLYLGNIYLSGKEIDRAIPFYSTVLKLNPKSVDGHINIGIALAAKGDVKESIRHLNEALSIDFANERAKALLKQFSSIPKW